MMRCEVAARLRLTATNGEQNATNKDVKEGEVSVSGKAEETQTVLVSRTANRRTKEAYNAYQREYMRRRRAR